MATREATTETEAQAQTGKSPLLFPPASQALGQLLAPGCAPWSSDRDEPWTLPRGTEQYRAVLWPLQPAIRDRKWTTVHAPAWRLQTEPKARLVAQNGIVDGEAVLGPLRKPAARIYCLTQTDAADSAREKTKICSCHP